MTLPDSPLQHAIDNAAGRIAPSWPLDSLLASSPYWGLRQQHFGSAHGTLQRLADSRLHLDEADYQQALRAGSIGLPHLQAALDEAGLQCAARDWLLQPASTPDSQGLERFTRSVCIKR